MATALTSLALGSVAKRPREVKPPLVKIRTIFQRGEAPEILDVEANLDPLEILKAAGVGILVGGVALAAGWLLWDGLAFPSPVGPVQIFRGVKETPFWQAEAERARLWLQLRRATQSGGELVTSATGLTAAQVEATLQQSIGDVECQLLNREWAKARRRGDSTSAESFFQQAKEKGCPWAQ